MLPYVLMAFQLVIFAIILYLMLNMFQSVRKSLAAQAERNTEARGRDPRAEANFGRDIGEMLNELRRTADQINGDLTVRSALLQRQLDEAERRINRLNELETRLRAIPQPDPNPSRPQAPAYPPPQSQQAPSRPTYFEPEIVPSRGPAADTEPFIPIELKEANRYQQVYRLADEGLSPLEIARRTRIGREEVEMLLGLREETRDDPIS